MAQTHLLPIPGVQHGERLAISILDERAQTNPQSPWVSIPVDDGDLSKGYRDITYSQFSNAVNHAAYWLVQNLPPSQEIFQSFAYAGPKDLRYAILAMAAGKLEKVMILPSAMITPEAQLRILEKKRCVVYVRAKTMATVVDGIVQRGDPRLQTVDAPELEELLQDKLAEPYVYKKSWKEGKDNPWLVFHTSGTTGYPKPITYTHRMMAIPDMGAKLSDEETHIHHYAFKRWYTPLPLIHFVGMLMVLSMSTFIHTVTVLGPSAPAPPSPKSIIEILKFGKADGALLVPAVIDALCQDTSGEGLAALRSLQYIHYAGAPLGVNSGTMLAPYVRVIPCIGSTEAGGYFTTLRNDQTDWDYIAFNKFAGAEFEPRLDNLYELVFVRKPEPEYASMQQIFLLYPDQDRFETNDLWIEHSERKGLWKIAGRTDDYVYLAHGDGLYASTLEQEIERHEQVKTALIGGHGRPKPMLLIETVKELQDKEHKALLQSLLPYLDKVNALIHTSVQIVPELVLIAKDKPLVRTMKGSVARMPSLKLYEKEIQDLYRDVT